MAGLSQGSKRGILMLLGVLVLILGWRLRAYWLRGQAETASAAAAAPPAERVEVNAADSAVWASLPGIYPKLAGRICKYRKKVGGFRSPEDLRAVYGLKPETLDALLPRLYADTTGPAWQALQAARPRQWNDRERREWMTQEAAQDAQGPAAHTGDAVQEPDPDKALTPPAKSRNMMLDLNLADSASLVQVPGIGEKTAGRIVKYRRLLGFFHSKEQLREVWGLSAENYDRMQEHFYLNAPLAGFPHIRINTATLEDLGRHPYIGWPAAKIILPYRTQHGAFLSIEDCRKVREVPATVWDKAGPYLDFAVK